LAVAVPVFFVNHAILKFHHFILKLLSFLFFWFRSKIKRLICWRLNEWMFENINCCLLSTTHRKLRLGLETSP
jgi:hypothetical protein